jgi:hypothetical protein
MTRKPAASTAAGFIDHFMSCDRGPPQFSKMKATCKILPPRSYQVFFLLSASDVEQCLE